VTAPVPVGACAAGWSPPAGVRRAGPASWGLVLVLWPLLGVGCAHGERIVTVPDLQELIRQEPVPAGHVACAVFDADGTLWDFDLSGTLVEQTLEARRGSDQGLPPLNDLLQTFDLPPAADVHEALRALGAAWSSGRLQGIGQQRGWDEQAVSLRVWPSYNWLYLGRSPAELAVQARLLLQEQKYQTRIFAGVRSLVTSLRAAGFRVLVISAGVHEFVQAATTDLGFAPAEVRGLQVAVQDGRLTPQVLEPIPYMQGKAVIARQLCGGKPMYAFGDSVASGDAALLELAAFPVAVKPHGRHRQAARQRGMRMLEHPAGPP